MQGGLSNGIVEKFKQALESCEGSGKQICASTPTFLPSAQCNPTGPALQANSSYAGTHTAPFLATAEHLDQSGCRPYPPLANEGYSPPPKRIVSNVWKGLSIVLAIALAATLYVLNKKPQEGVALVKRPPVRIREPPASRESPIDMYLQHKSKPPVQAALLPRNKTVSFAEEESMECEVSEGEQQEQLVEEDPNFVPL